MQIRQAEERDLADLARLWQERQLLLQQGDPRIQFPPQAAQRWRAAARAWLAAEDYAFFVATARAAIVGFAVLTIVPGPAGLLPEKLGLLLEMAVDLHAAHRGLGGGLLAQAKAWLRARGIAHLKIESPARYSVEEAFWRGQGGPPRAQTYWLTV